MPRQLKPQLIDTVRDPKTNDRVEIYFDRNSLDFFAKVGDETVRDPTADGVKGKARASLSTLRKFEWSPFIYAQTEHEHQTLWGRGRTIHNTGHVKLIFWRVEVAKKPDGRFVERPYLDENGLHDNDVALGEKGAKTIAESNRRRRESGEDIEHHYEPAVGDGTVKLAYDEAVWIALCAIKDRIDAAAKQLDDLLESKDFEKRLKLVAKNLKLLPERT